VVVADAEWVAPVVVVGAFVVWCVVIAVAIWIERKIGD
jgi:hypothetical protein